MTTIPRFELRRVYADGSETLPLVVPVLQLPASTNMHRRGFLGAGIASSAALAMLSGCKPDDDARSDPDGGAKAAAAPTSACSPARTTIERCDPPGVPAPPGVRSQYDENASLAQLLLSPDSKTLCSLSRPNSCGYAGRLKTWRVEDSKRLVNILGPTPPAALAGPDRLVTANDDPSTTGADLQLWDLASGEKIETFPGPGTSIIALACSPDGKYVISSHTNAGVATDDGYQFIIRELSSGKATFSSHENPPLQFLAVTPDGKWVVGADTSNARVVISSVPEGRVLRVLKIADSLDHVLSALVLAGDGSFIVAAYRKPGIINPTTIAVHDLRDYDCVKEWEAYRGADISAMALTPDGKLLLTCNDGRGEPTTLNCWSIGQGSELWREPVTRPITSMLVASDGKTLYTAEAADAKTAVASRIVRSQLRTGCRSIQAVFADDEASQGEYLTYTAQDSSGQLRSYTASADASLPDAAECTCNSVMGLSRESNRVKTCPSGPGSTTRIICTCNTVCTCVPVFL